MSLYQQGYTPLQCNEREFWGRLDPRLYLIFLFSLKGFRVNWWWGFQLGGALTSLPTLIECRVEQEPPFPPAGFHQSDELTWRPRLIGRVHKPLDLRRTRGGGVSRGGGGTPARTVRTGSLTPSQLLINHHFGRARLFHSYSISLNGRGRRNPALLVASPP